MIIKPWKKFENKTAKLFGGKRNKGSGNKWYAPGDVRSEKFLFENKQTSARSFRVSSKLWNKIYEEALFSYRIPVLAIQMPDIELIVISKEDFKNLLQDKDTA